MKNTSENLAMVETFLTVLICGFPRVLSFTFHIVEAPGPFLRQIEQDIATTSDQGTAWVSIEKCYL